MLEDLIISRVRVKILTLFLSSPGKICHVREIVRLLNEEINAVRRELAHLEKAGLVSKEPRANRLYYSFRTDYQLYYELLAIISKTTYLGGAILKNKNKLGKIKYLIFSQKFIRNLPKKADDVDLMAIGNIVIPELSKLIKEEEARKNTEINYTAMTEEEFNFRKRRHDPFISDILSRPRTIIIGDEEEMVKVS